MKPFSFLVFLLVCSYASLAQSNLGVKGGINFSGLDTDSNFGFQVTFGWHGGIIGKTYIGEMGYFLQGELLFQQQGNQNHNLDYIKVPAMIGFDFGEDVNGHMGFYYANQISGNDNFKSSDFGGLLGMDFYFSKKLMSTIRLDYGFNNIVKDDANVNFFVARNAVIGLSLTYIFFKNVK